MTELLALEWAIRDIIPAMRACALVLLFTSVVLVGCQTGPAEPEPPPNILFAIADDISYPHMGAYGTSWVSTPAFDRVAREGVLFDRAYTPNAKCAPSRSVILTGRHSWQLGAAANHWPYFPEEYRTWAEALADHGYHVGYTGKGWGPGQAGKIDGQPRLLAGTPYQEHKATPPAEHVSDNDYAANFAAFLEARPEGQPFCFWYGALEPHRAYQYGVGVSEDGRQPAGVDAVPPYWPDTEAVRTDMLDYAFEIEHFDLHLQRMLARLEEEGELERTLVVVTSDNGMPFPRAKGQAYEVSNHMPLAAMWPAGIEKPGRTVDDFVSFVDLAPTFLEMAEISEAASGMLPIEGQSLLDILRSRGSGQIDPKRDHVLVGKERHDVGRPNDQGYPIRGIVTDSWLFLVNFEPDRWPAGNPETGYLNTDGSPTKTDDPRYATERGRHEVLGAELRQAPARRAVPPEERPGLRGEPGRGSDPGRAQATAARAALRRARGAGGPAHARPGSHFRGVPVLGRERPGLLRAFHGRRETRKRAGSNPRISRRTRSSSRRPAAGSPPVPRPWAPG